MQGYQLLSRTTVDKPVRSCAFSHDGSMLAAGMSDGSFMVLKTKYEHCCLLKLNSYFKVFFRF